MWCKDNAIKYAKRALKKYIKDAKTMDSNIDALIKVEYQ